MRGVAACVDVLLPMPSSVGARLLADVADATGLTVVFGDAGPLRQRPGCYDPGAGRGGPGRATEIEWLASDLAGPMRQTRYGFPVPLLAWRPNVATASPRVPRQARSRFHPSFACLPRLQILTTYGCSGNNKSSRFTCGHGRP